MSFETYRSELRTMCTIQSWILVSGKTVLMASGKPVRASTAAIKMSFNPRSRSSISTDSRNLDPSIVGHP
jgi:hypothetical protein